jgi:hypothetical protein
MSSGVSTEPAASIEATLARRRVRLTIRGATEKRVVPRPIHGTGIAQVVTGQRGRRFVGISESATVSSHGHLVAEQAISPHALPLQHPPTAPPIRRRLQIDFRLLRLSPMAVLMLLFLIGPLAVIVGMSFFHSTIFGIETTPMFANYAKLFTEPMYGILLLKSVRMALMVTAIVC